MMARGLRSSSATSTTSSPPPATCSAPTWSARTRPARWGSGRTSRAAATWTSRCSAPGRSPTRAKRTLVARLRHEALPCPARGLELVVYDRAVAASGTPEPGFEVELNTGAAMPFRRTLDPADRPAADGRFWYGLDRSILHQSGLHCSGRRRGGLRRPRPGRPARLLVEALTWWLPHTAGRPTRPRRDAVLGACRSLVRLRDGVWLAKVEAGQRLIAAGERAVVRRRSPHGTAGRRPPGRRPGPSNNGYATRSPGSGRLGEPAALSGPGWTPARRRAG